MLYACADDSSGDVTSTEMVFEPTFKEIGSLAVPDATVSPLTDTDEFSLLAVGVTVIADTE